MSIRQVGSALSGAASGAQLGSSLGPKGAIVGGLIGGIGGLLSGSDDRAKQEQFDRALAEQNRMLKKNYAMQSINDMQAPQLTPAMQARIRALEEQSRPTALVEDPFFQGQRQTLVQGGQQALSGIQNQQRGYGVAGGFRNIGSMADVYDRLSGQIANLGQQSIERKDRMAQQAAEMQQSYQDSVIAFENARARARAAIEAGYYDEANQALAEAAEARQRMMTEDLQGRSDLLGGISNLASGYVSRANSPSGQNASFLENLLGLKNNTPVNAPEITQAVPAAGSYLPGDVRATKPFSMMRGM